MERFNEKQMQQLADYFATKEDFQNLNELVTNVATKQNKLFDLVKDFVGKQDDEHQENLITKQYVTENRDVIIKLADKARVETRF